MRLGFAVAIHVDPDVLLIDEVLAVGDEAFTRKCLDKLARVPPPRQDDPVRDPQPRPRREDVRRGALAAPRPRRSTRATPSASSTPISPTSRAAKREPRRGERRAQAEASGGLAAPDAPADGSPSAAGCARGPLGQPRGRDPLAAPARRARSRAARVRARREPDARALGPRRDGGRGLRVRRRPLLRGRDQRLRHQHATSSASSPPGCSATPRYA